MANEIKHALETVATNARKAMKFLTRNHHEHRDLNHTTNRGDAQLVNIDKCTFDRGQVRTRVFTKEGSFVTSFPAHFSDTDIKLCLYRMNDAYSRGIEKSKT